MLLVEVVHFVKVVVLQVSGSLAFHVIQLFLEFFGVIGFDELFIHGLYSSEKLGVVLNLSQRFL